MSSSSPLRVAHCFQPRRRRLAQQAVDEGRAERKLSWDVLSPERIQTLARVSLYLFLVGMVLFLGLNLLVFRLETGQAHVSLSWGLVLLVILTNILAYLLVLALHEGLHGVVFALLGGRPTFGAKLPFALYCGAPNQLFTRGGYLAVGLAPLVVISLAGIVLIALAPGLAPFVQLGLIGNFSGAAGDLWAARVLLAQPPTALLLDTASGFEVYEVQRGV
ncbi:MAG TPA: DUF3267 domain-containing protein [Ktedonobacterales bacterium]|nr:DUF3267 domain-containing protein [Ktedonobacterales bacterium]